MEYVAVAADNTAYFNQRFVTQLSWRNKMRQLQSLSTTAVKVYAGFSYRYMFKLVDQSQDSVQCNTYQCVHQGAHLSRDAIHVDLQAANANCLLYGLSQLQGQQHHDTHSVIEHSASNTQSGQHYRGLYADKSRGVFNGKVIVPADTRQASAKQENHNLLLGEFAEIDTKPELEIYADDVQCSHGATVGQLDPAALFYLRSRGIAQADAQVLLTQGFVNALLDQIAGSALLQGVNDDH